MLGDQIRKYRRLRDLTQADLADQIGVARTRISRWERGNGMIPADLVPKICKALKISIYQIYFSIPSDYPME